MSSNPSDKSFLDAIESGNGSDSELRLVYADWLEEQGRDAQATYLRLEVQLKDPTLERATIVELTYQLRDLRHELDDKWRRRVSLSVVENCNVSDADDGLFEFECPLTWTSLSETVQDNVRFCDACKQHVHLCDSMSEAIWFARRGACVAIDVCTKPSKVKKLPSPDANDPISQRRMGRVQVNHLTLKRTEQLKRFPSKPVKTR